ncbi:Protein phosphatase 1 (Glc7p) regulatory subunit [Komagataella phaffii CBS 7435]|uniref:Uncharacterized protein n=2 Tax=Komagataella phaffii TaxID=460519 RepID=C4R077_KOMPG|nr:Hypothetical protein PAS_chr2-1_0288 [Komagataella phaffii GS115]AOA62039.1 GQ67_00320T0 [Komagataella phaffii]CAH2448595.1 Protein phosphatase 1 (Glc7p) regulatory subunit [Komagataella phaffii CBS 7435]AOA67210.1 GQ68_01069T0 [Komagataella phaffii GS115]CAY68901.1 Hypothetical protein PAS_chr2-1_0288 [Komagataella phaffii GS115]CCA38696.1 Protein phosphatase 1 (Glc7p) regulatory subunit [Komagataella phaffii CBS 7435]
MTNKPRGILRNAPQDTNYDENAKVDEEFDRKKVLENTNINAKLFKDAADAAQTKGDKIRQKLKEKKQQLEEEHLKWNEANLYMNEQEKCATMKIDEPKTPYEGGVDPTGEYYQDDEEELDNFALGEPEFTVPKEEQEPFEPSEPSEPSSEDSETEHAPKETAQQKHKRFEEMRKQHYHLKGSVLGKPLSVSDEEEDETEESK